MRSDHLVEVDPFGYGRGSPRGESAGSGLEHANADPRDLAAEERRRVIEPNEIDLCSGDPRQGAREGELLAHRKVLVDRENSDVDIAADAGLARRL